MAGGCHHAADLLRLDAHPPGPVGGFLLQPNVLVHLPGPARDAGAASQASAVDGLLQGEKAAEQHGKVIFMWFIGRMPSQHKSCMGMV